MVNLLNDSYDSLTSANHFLPAANIDNSLRHSMLQGHQAPLHNNNYYYTSQPLYSR